MLILTVIPDNIYMETVKLREAVPLMGVACGGLAMLQWLAPTLELMGNITWVIL